MKFSIYSDVHFTTKRPRARIDPDYNNNILAKVKEVYEVSVAKKMDFVLFLGDFFNTHKVYDFELLRNLIATLSQYPIKTYSIVGQHDLLGYNKDSYKSSTLAFFEHFSDNFEVLWEPLKVGDVVIHPCHSFDNLEEIIKKPLPESKINILAAHKLITVQKMVYSTYLVNDLLPCGYDGIFFGDLHIGMEPYQDENTLVWGPGAISRIAISDADRQVKMGVVDVQDGKKLVLEQIPLTTMKKKIEVFSEDFLDRTKQKEVEFDVDGFVQSIRGLEKTAVSIFDIIENVAKERKIDESVITYILSKRNEANTITT